MTDTSVITASALGFRAQSKAILEDLSFEVPKGAFVVVVGENGAGKTSLLRLLMGLSRPSQGTLRVLGGEPGRDVWADRRRVAYVSEKMSPPADWTVEDYLAFNREFYPEYSRVYEDELLKAFRLSPGARFGHLSAGEIRRAQVVGALAFSPEVLVVDEITAVLDIVGRSRFLKQLRALRARVNTTVVMATNILDDVDSYATHLMLLHRGRLQFAETKEALLASGGGKSLTDLLAERIERAESS